MDLNQVHLLSFFLSLDPKRGQRRDSFSYFAKKSRRDASSAKSGSTGTGISVEEEPGGEDDDNVDDGGGAAGAFTVAGTGAADIKMPCSNVACALAKRSRVAIWRPISRET